MNKIVSFPALKISPKSLKEWEKRVRELSRESKNVFWGTLHTKQRMKERDVTSRQILDVLRLGKGIDGPTLDQYGDWRIKLSRYSAGRLVQVVVAVKEEHLEVITVI